MASGVRFTKPEQLQIHWQWEAMRERCGPLCRRSARPATARCQRSRPPSGGECAASPGWLLQDDVGRRQTAYHEQQNCVTDEVV